MKIFVIISFIVLHLSAEDNYSCLEKMDQLKKLKSQKETVVEKSGLYFLSGNLTVFFQSKEEKELDEKIRILEIELESCKSN